MFDEFSGKDLSNIPRARDNDSSNYSEEEEDKLDIPINPDPNNLSFHKIIKISGEGTEKPGNLDEATIEIDQGPGPAQQLLKLQEQSPEISKLIQSMKKNEVSEFFIDSSSQGTYKLLDWVQIKDILNDGSLVKRVTKPGMGYELIEYKDDVKMHIKVYQGQTDYINTTQIVSCEVPAISGGLFEILKTMKLLEQATIKISNSYFLSNFQNLCEVTKDDIYIDISIEDLKKVEDMYLDGSFYKKYFIEGDGKNLPNPNALVRIHYKLEISGNIVLSNFDEDLLEIRMDEDEVPSLWTHCLRQMKEGDVMKVDCNMMGLHANYLNDGLNPKYNYDTYAIEDVHSCVFYISLVSFDMGKVNYNMTYEDRCVEANRIKDAGNKLFKIGRFDKALEKYEAANSSLEPITDCPYLLRPIHLLLFGNITLTYLKMEKWHEAETNARKILEYNPNDVKALYRRALARIELENFDPAMQDLKNAKMNCEGKGDKEMLAAVCKEISRVNTLMKGIKEKEKSMYSKLFSN